MQVCKSKGLKLWKNVLKNITRSNFPLIFKVIWLLPITEEDISLLSISLLFLLSFISYPEIADSQLTIVHKGFFQILGKVYK